MVEKQLTEISRYNNNISAHKVLSVKDGSIIIKMPWGIITEMQIWGDSFSEGDWIDLQVRTNGSRGKISSYSAKYLGRTPMKFIPIDKNVQYITS